MSANTHTLPFTVDLNVMILLLRVKAALNEALLHEECERCSVCVDVLFIIALTELLIQHSSHQS